MLNKKTCVVTGASGSIGKAIVNKFSLLNYNVIAIDKLNMPKDMNCFFYLKADLSRCFFDKKYCNRIFNLIKKKLTNEKLHILINNAGQQTIKKINKIQREDWECSLNVNLLTPFLLIQFFLKELKFAKGHVLNISSIHAKLTKKYFTTYSTSKAALSAMTRSLALELAPEIKINALELGAVETSMLKKSFGNSSKSLVKLKSIHPQNKIGQPDEIALFIESIIKNNISFLHGSCIDFTGGMHSKLSDI